MPGSLPLLYQFPISHYCEKARWALEYKNVAYQCKNVLPGPHVKQLLKVAPKTHVPLLRTKEHCIQGSDQIIDYLDSIIAESQLTPPEPIAEAEARKWETYAEKHIGDPIRCIIYHDLLEFPRALIPVLTHQGPWYGKLLYRLIYPKFKQTARKAMKINAETAEQNRQLLGKAVHELSQHLANRQFMVGNSFTRADLAVASLFSPLVTPQGGYFIWWESMPDNLKHWREQVKNERVFQWVNEIYRQYR